MQAAYITEQFEAAGYDVLSIHYSYAEETVVVTTSREAFRFEHAADETEEDAFVSRSGRTVVFPFEISHPN